MKNNRLLLTLIFLPCLITVGFNQVDKAKAGHFFTIDDNIENDDLRFELEQLKKEFTKKRTDVFKSYESRIKVLEEERRKEVKILKKSFKQQRDDIYAKYKENRKNNISKNKNIKMTQDSDLTPKSKIFKNKKSERKKRKIKSDN